MKGVFWNIEVAKATNFGSFPYPKVYNMNLEASPLILKLGLRTSIKAFPLSWYNVFVQQIK